jgi:hypothetical protein
MARHRKRKQKLDSANRKFIIKVRARATFNRACDSIGLRRGIKKHGDIMVVAENPMIVGSETIALLALLRLRRKIAPLFVQAEAELNRRYKNTKHQKRRERSRVAALAYHLNLAKRPAPAP